MTSMFQSRWPVAEQCAGLQVAHKHDLCSGWIEALSTPCRCVCHNQSGKSIYGPSNGGHDHSSISLKGYTRK